MFLPARILATSLAVVALFSATSAWSAAGPADSLSRGLMAHWPLDDGVADPAALSAVELIRGVGTPLTSPDPTTAWLGASEARFNGAIRVDGANTYLSVPADEALDPKTNQVSLSLWVRLELLPSQLPAGFGGIYDSGQDAYVVYLDRGNRELRFKITDATGAAARPGIPETLLVTGEWLHIAAVYDGNASETAGEARVYLNGELIDTHTGNDGSGGVGLKGTVRSGQIAAMGRDGAGAQYFLASSLDDVAIWRRALAGEEIAYLAEGNKVPPARPPEDALTIVTPPANARALEGSYAVFRVGISNGVAPISYQWRLNGVDVPGATLPQLSVVASTETAGRYTVVVRDNRGSLESSGAILRVTPLASEPSASLRQGLVALWPLDDGLLRTDTTEVVDVINGNLGQLVAADPTTAWLGTETARFSGALQLDGSTTYVSVPISPTLDFASDQVTVAAWVNLSVLPSGLPEGFGGIFDSVQDNYVLYLDRGNRELRFKVTDARGQAARPGIPESSLVQGEWIHVAGVYNGRAGQAAGEATIYLNGTLMDTHVGNDGSGGNGLNAFVRTGQAAAIGRNGTENRYLLTGSVDDLAVWSRALAPGEIAYLAGGQPVPRPEPLRVGAPLADGQTITLRWSGAEPPYQVQQRANLGSGSWENVGTATESTTVTLPREQGPRFYRVLSGSGVN